MTTLGRCPVCGALQRADLYKVASVPVNSCLVMTSHDQAVGIGRSRIDLVQCLMCGFVWNQAFDDSSLSYDLTYEDSQAFSGRFAEYAQSLASAWVRDWGLKGETVVEIGAGRGDFSRALVDQGVGRVVAIDPTDRKSVV